RVSAAHHDDRQDERSPADAFIGRARIFGLAGTQGPGRGTAGPVVLIGKRSAVQSTRQRLGSECSLFELITRLIDGRKRRTCSTLTGNIRNTKRGPPHERNIVTCTSAG